MSTPLQVISLILLFYWQPFSDINAKAGESERCTDTCISAFDDVLKYARNGSMHAQTLVAITYKMGILEAKSDPSNAWKWLNRATSQSFAPAQYLASQWYSDGYGTDHDATQAQHYLTQASDSGYAPALFELGVRKLNQGYSNIGLTYIQEAAVSNHARAKLLLQHLTKQNIDKHRFKLDDSAVTVLLENSSANNIFSQNGIAIAPEVLFLQVTKAISQQGLYSTKGTTGSHISNIKCGQAESLCKLIRMDDDGINAEMWLDENS